MKSSYRVLVHVILHACIFVIIIIAGLQGLAYAQTPCATRIPSAYDDLTSGATNEVSGFACDTVPAVVDAGSHLVRYFGFDNTYASPITNVRITVVYRTTSAPVDDTYSFEASVDGTFIPPKLILAATAANAPAYTTASVDLGAITYPEIGTLAVQLLGRQILTLDSYQIEWDCTYIEIFGPCPTLTPTFTPTGIWYTSTPSPTFTNTDTPTNTPTPTNTATRTPSPTYTPTPLCMGPGADTCTPTPTSDCDTDASLFSHWSACENIRGSIPGTKSTVWQFDDCDYCRDIDNPCFTTPCTFAMYVTAECGTVFHVPLWDNETGNIQIKNCKTGAYEWLTAASTGGWSAAGTNIRWTDCAGTDPRWNNQTTDISFDDPVALCGVYRVEFIDWGGFVWDLYANCTGTSDPGFFIYDNLAEARASHQLRPELSISNISVTGTCPNYLIGADVTNTGCDEADVPVCIETSLGGHWEFTIYDVGPGETKSGSGPIVAPSCSVGYTIIAYVDCNNEIIECSEAGGSAIACSPPGTGSDYVTYDILFTPTPIPTNTPTFTPTPPPTIFCCWDPAVNAGPVLNSAARDWHPCLASDNITLFFASARPGGRGKSDLWMSQRIAPWGPTDWAAPVNLGTNINTEQLEAAPSLSFDTMDLYFEAYNKVNATIDIFYSSWNTMISGWRIRRPMPNTINYMSFDERHPFITRDNKQLYYDTNRTGGPGDFDIWVSEYVSGYWFPPNPLPEPINTSGYEAAPYIYYYPGGRQLYFETTRSGPNELFVSEWDSIHEEWEPPKRMCLDFISSLHPSINTIGSELLYHTYGTYGDYDIHVSVCLPTPTPTGVWYSPTPTATSTPHIPVDDISALQFLMLLALLSLGIYSAHRKYGGKKW